jgi:hypothetical protein
MALALGTSGSFGIAFLVSYGITAEAIAKDVSSPQTAEINIRKRQHTLMKWVHVGQAESAVMIGIAAFCDKKHRVPILWGGFLGMAVTELEYLYAKSSGLNNPGPETEEY